jgi:hypothetical protein
MGTPLTGFSTDPAKLPLPAVASVMSPQCTYCQAWAREPEQHYTVRVKDRHIGLDRWPADRRVVGCKLRMDPGQVQDGANLPDSAFIGNWLLPQLGIHLGAGIIAAIINCF